MNLPAQLKTGSARVFKFTDYFLKSRGKPGHVDQITALEAISNPLHYEEQRIDSETRHCVTGTSTRHPGKYIRVILLDDLITIHNAFLDRGVKKKVRGGT